MNSDSTRKLSFYGCLDINNSLIANNTIQYRLEDDYFEDYKRLIDFEHRQCYAHIKKPEICHLDKTHSSCLHAEY